MVDIIGYEGLYAITPCGKVWSYRANKFLKASPNSSGYPIVQLSKKGKRLRVHRLVAEAYIPNPNNYPIINHKDENKANNCVSNLEWCNHSYNHTYNGLNIRQAKKLGTAIIRVEDGKEYYSIRQAARENGIYKNAIQVALKNKNKTAGGYHWQRRN